MCFLHFPFFISCSIHKCAIESGHVYAIEKTPRNNNNLMADSNHTRYLSASECKLHSVLCFFLLCTAGHQNTYELFPYDLISYLDKFKDLKHFASNVYNGIVFV